MFWKWATLPFARVRIQQEKKGVGIIKDAKKSIHKLIDMESRSYQSHPRPGLVHKYRFYVYIINYHYYSYHTYLIRFHLLKTICAMSRGVTFKSEPWCMQHWRWVDYIRTWWAACLELWKPFYCAWVCVLFTKFLSMFNGNQLHFFQPHGTPSVTHRRRHYERDSLSIIKIDLNVCRFLSSLF